jgi:hypothetical protein
MTTINDAIYTYLTTAGRATEALIGTRLYPLNLPQNPTYPAATYQRITSQLTTTGQSEPGDLEDALYQFDAYATSHSGAKALAGALRADLSGYKGDMGGVEVDAIHFQNEYDFWGAEAGVWRVTLEFRFLFNV